MATNTRPACTHPISTDPGIPVELLVTPGSVHDNTALQAINLPENSYLYGDRAHLNDEAKNCWWY